jgi:hypothetical protein
VRHAYGQDQHTNCEWDNRRSVDYIRQCSRSFEVILTYIVPMGREISTDLTRSQIISGVSYTVQ